jgi:hypothetical protein
MFTSPPVLICTLPSFPSKAVWKPSLLLELLLSLNKANRKKAYKPYFQKRNISKTQFSSLVYLEEKFGKISEMLQLVTPTTFLITNSKPLVDLYVIEARWGHISKGK